MTELTAEDLTAIRKRAEAACPGTWYRDRDGELYPWAIGAYEDIAELHEEVAGAVYRIEDAEFIVNARRDVLTLLAELGRLTAELARTNAKLSHLAGLHRAEQGAREEAEAEVQRRGEANTLLAKLNTETHQKLDATLEERDLAQEAADALAEAIAEMTGGTVGEHSNLNDPWANALALADALRVKPAAALSPTVPATTDDHRECDGSGWVTLGMMSVRCLPGCGRCRGGTPYAPAAVPALAEAQFAATVAHCTEQINRSMGRLATPPVVAEGSRSLLDDFPELADVRVTFDPRRNTAPHTARGPKASDPDREHPAHDGQTCNEYEAAPVVAEATQAEPELAECQQTGTCCSTCYADFGECCKHSAAPAAVPAAAADGGVA